MFGFLKRKPSPELPSSRMPQSPDDETWHAGAIGSANDTGYDDVSLAESGAGQPARAHSSTGGSPGAAGGGSSNGAPSATRRASRPSFSQPDASPGAFVGGVSSAAGSAYDSATSSANLASAARGGGASYPPSRQAGSRLASTNGYPSLRSTFTRLEAALAESAPTLLDSLSAPLLPTAPALSSLLHAISPYYLPAPVLESYILHDGQDPFSSCQQGLVWGLHWLPIDEVEQEWHFWRRFEQAGGEQGMHDAFSARTSDASSARGSGRIHPYVHEADEDDAGAAGVGMPGMSAFPPGWVRSRYSHPGWLPLLTDRVGNYIGVDLDPPPPSGKLPHGTAGATYGQPGQVIAFGREIDEKVVLFPGDSAGGWGRFLAAFADDIDRGEFAVLKEAAASERKRGGDSDWRGGQNGDGGGSSDEDSWDDGDGLGDVDYLDGDRYGDEGERGAQLWALRSEYRRWVAGGGEGGLIGAIAERSRRQWRAVGVGLDSSSAGSSLKSPPPPLSIIVPAGDDHNDDERGPESAATERPHSPTATDSARASLDQQQPHLPTSSTSSSLQTADESFSSDHPLTTSESIELTLSPPSPKMARFESQLPLASSSSGPTSPEYLDDGRRRAAEQRRAANGSSRTRRRPPPPAPMPFDLPTMMDLESPLPGTTASADDQNSIGNGYGPTGMMGRRSADSFGAGGNTPTRQSLLPATASTTALVPGDEGLGFSHLNLGGGGSGGGEMEVVVQQNRSPRLEDDHRLDGTRSPPLGSRSPSSNSDQPYLSPRGSEDSRRDSPVL